jgi:thymidylate synthase ThyX
MWHTVIVTATDWDGFWNQRCSPLAQPEIRAAAEAMLHDAYQMSKPTDLGFGEWHTPYILPEEYEILREESRKRISVARCARVSYLTHDGIKDHAADLDMYLKLISARPMHASPLEHVATPALTSNQQLGNLKGYRQLRHMVEHAVLLGS